VYRSGYLNQANNLRVPIIDIRGTSNIEIHDSFHSWSMRARLERANGNHDNQIIWNSFTASGFVIDQALEAQAFFLMDRWLSAIEADTSNRSFAEKVVYDKPSDAVDRCTIPGTGVASPCVVPQSGSPRLGAGEPLTDDTAKCQPQGHEPYRVLPESVHRRAVAPAAAGVSDGVCDYTKAGVNQQATVPWMTYSNGPGGQPLAMRPCPIRSAAPTAKGRSISGC